MSKKKHQHHGGAWKVAYADFVTAMMALFMVLWISAQDKEILIATSQYFQNPFNSPMDRSSGVMPSEPVSSARESRQREQSNMVDFALLHALANELYRLLNLDAVDIDEKPIDITVTSDGLRITMFNRDEHPIFNKGSDTFTEWGALVVQNLAWVMEQHPMNVRIDSFASGDSNRSKEDSAWLLASNRANAVRQKLVHFALDPRKIEKVTSQVLDAIASEDPHDAQRVELSFLVNQ